jgi:hypothetical protein
MWSAVAVGETWTGNLVSGPPELRSLRWPRGEGPGLVARLREPLAIMARARASMLALRFDSSVLMARGRVSTLTLWEREEARLSSVKIASLWLKRSRIRRYEYRSSIVMDVSTFGRRMQGARLVARAAM